VRRWLQDVHGRDTCPTHGTGTVLVDPLVTRRYTVLIAPLVQDLLLTALPGGGQRTARQNAWAGMSADASRSRARREAEAALEVAVRNAQRRAGTGS